MRRLHAALLLGTISFLATVTLHAVGVVDRLELLALDARYTSGLGRKAPRNDIVVAWIDQASMDWTDQRDLPFPWPRSMYANALNYMLGGGARAVVFDILLDQNAQAEDDGEFTAALKAGKGDVLAMKFMTSRQGGRNDKETARFAQRALVAVTPPKVKVERGLSMPLPDFEAGADQLGFVNVRSDIDKAFRHYDVLRPFAAPGTTEAKSHPSLALAAALAAHGKLPALDRVADDGRILLNFRGPEFTFEHIKFVNILVSMEAIENKQPPPYPAERFQDKIVFVGINAEGYEDAHPTPVSRLFPGVELHATALDNLLENDALRAPRWEVPLAAAAAAAVTATVFLLPGVTTPLLALVGLLLAALAAALLAWVNLLAVPIAAPALSGGLAAGGSFLWRLIVEGKQKREIKRAFASYLAPEVLETVLKDPERLALGGATRTVTLLFTDLAGFTGLAEHCTPQELVAFLNDYFTRMCEPVLVEHGVIDKFIGDAIMALFGAPIDAPDHGLRAVRAALVAREVSQAIDAGLRAAGKPPIETRIGIHSGLAVVGNMGSSKRFDYTAIGDTVNLASRLEGANKAFGTQCMVSETAWAMVGDAVVGREIGSVGVKGRAAPIRVWEPLAVRELVTAEQTELATKTAAALAALRSGDRAAAKAAFASMAARWPKDALIAMYGERLAEANWDGVFRLDSK